MEYGVQLGRRFRALKLWYVFRYYGREGVIALLRESLRLAQLLKTLVESNSDFELSAPVPLSACLFPAIALTMSLMSATGGNQCERPCFSLAHRAPW